MRTLKLGIVALFAVCMFYIIGRIMYSDNNYSYLTKLINIQSNLFDKNNTDQGQFIKRDDSLSYEYFFDKPINKPQSTLIKVYKKERLLELNGDSKLIGRFKIALGGEPNGDKNAEGDLKTPEGKYYICTRNDSSNFTLFMGISYPNKEDALRGFNAGIINKDLLNQISKCEELKQLPPWNTPLGGAVGFHGGGNAYDWTRGCIALTDEDIRILWEYTPLKMPVEIYDTKQVD